MTTTGHFSAVAVAMLLAGTAPALAGSTPLALRAQPGTDLDSVARQLVAPDLARAARAGETPLVLVGAAQLGYPAEPPMVFVQLQSPRECGSAGCSTSAYVFKQRGWHKVLDAVSGLVLVDGASHRGMRDLIVHERDRWVWDGAAYGGTKPAPEVDLRPTRLSHVTR